MEDRPEWQVLALESPITFECEGLTFKGRIDRIDRTGELNRLVIDHKTGSTLNYNQLNWDPNELKDTQMPMYALAEDSCDGIAYITFSNKDAQPKPDLRGIRRPVENVGDVPPRLFEVLHKDKAPYSLEELKPTWEKVLQKAIQDFLSGVAEVRPVDEKKVCEYCHLDSLCRINEHQSTSFIEEGE